MATTLRTPGVYREESFARAPDELPTGVPAFVGLGVALGPDLQPSEEAQEIVDPAQLDARWVGAKNKYSPARDSYLADAVRGFFANGGRRCLLVGAGDPETGGTPDPDGGKQRLKAAIDQKLAALDVDLVAVPDAMTLAPLAPEDAREVQQKLVMHCTAEGNRFALLDAFVTPGTTDPSPELLTWRDGAVRNAPQALDPSNAALYFPWVWPADADRPVPPCGHVAGVIARADARDGVFKAPANEELSQVVDLDFAVDFQAHGDLNAAGINCLVARPGRGIRVLGARTLSADPQWRYLNVRRVFITLSRWIDRNLAWAPFEPNGARLWDRIQRELDAYLSGLWRAGALQGRSADEAYFVKCDEQTNPPESRERGEVLTQIGLAPASPAEFIVVHVTQRAGSTQLS